MTCIWVDCQDAYREAMANIAPKENVARGLQAYPSWDRLDGIEKARIARMEARAKDDKATKAMAQRRQRVLEALPGTMDEVAESTGCKRSTLERDMRILRSVGLVRMVKMARNGSCFYVYYERIGSQDYTEEMARAKYGARGDANRARGKESRGEIVALLQREPMTRRQIVARSSLTESTVKNLLWKMSKGGAIQATGKDDYETIWALVRDGGQPKTELQRVCDVVMEHAKKGNFTAVEMAEKCHKSESYTRKCLRHMEAEGMIWVVDVIHGRTNIWGVK